jgi:hypothetical protein
MMKDDNRKSPEFVDLLILMTLATPALAIVLFLVTLIME